MASATVIVTVIATEMAPVIDRNSDRNSDRRSDFFRETRSVAEQDSQLKKT